MIPEVEVVDCCVAKTYPLAVPPELDPLIQVPLSEKQPPERAMPLAKVDVAVVEVAISVPTVIVPVEVPDTADPLEAYQAN